jgi:hypothetical protein
MVARIYARSFPRLNRAQGMWDRSAQMPWTTRFRLAAQTVWYALMTLAVTSVLLALAFVFVLRGQGMWSAASWYCTSYAAFFLVAAIAVLSRRAARRMRTGLDADSELALDITGEHHARHLARLTGAAPALPGYLRPTRRALEEVAVAAGLARPPKLLRVPGPALNAFVDGVGEHMVVGVTRAFTECLTFAEQQAAIASLVARALGEMPDVFGEAGLSMVAPTRVLRDRALNVYLRADHAGAMLTRDPASMICALQRTIDTPAGTRIGGLSADLAPQLWAWPKALPYVIADDGVELPEFERIAALREVAGVAGATAARGAAPSPAPSPAPSSPAPSDVSAQA